MTVETIRNEPFGYLFTVKVFNKYGYVEREAHNLDQVRVREVLNEYLGHATILPVGQPYEEPRYD